MIRTRLGLRRAILKRLRELREPREEAQRWVVRQLSEYVTFDIDASEVYPYRDGDIEIALSRALTDPSVIRVGIHRRRARRSPSRIIHFIVTEDAILAMIQYGLND